MSEGASRSIWDIFAHESRTNLPRLTEQEKGVDVEGPMKSTSSTSSSVNLSSSTFGGEPKKKNTVTPKKVLQKCTKQPTSQRTSPRKCSKPDPSKKEPPEDDAASINVRTDLKKKIEKLRTKMKPPGSIIEKEKEHYDVGTHQTKGADKGSLLQCPLYIKQEPPDIKVKMDMSEKNSKVLPESKVHSRHSNIFEMMPILFDTETDNSKECKESDRKTYMASYLRSNDNTEVPTFQETKTLPCSNVNTSCSEQKAVKIECDEQKLLDGICERAELCKDTNKLEKPAMPEKTVVCRKGTASSKCLSKKEDSVTKGCKNMPVKAAIGKETFVSQKQQAKNRIKSRKSPEALTKGTNPKSFPISEIEDKSNLNAADFSELKKESSCDLRERRSEGDLYINPLLDKLEQIEKPQEEFDSNLYLKSPEIINKSGDDYIVLDSLSSRECSEAENVQNRPCFTHLLKRDHSNTLLDTDTSDKLQIDKPFTEDAKEIDMAGSDDNGLVSPLRRSSRKVKAREFPDSVTFSSKKSLPLKTDGTKHAATQLAHELPLDLTVLKEVVQLQNKEEEHSRKEDTFRKLASDVMSNQSCVLDKISGNIESSDSQEGEPGDVFCGKSLCPAPNTANSNILQQTADDTGSDKLISVSSSKHSSDIQACDKHTVSSFEQNRPLSILGTTKKKVIVAEVKPNNAAVLTFPTGECPDNSVRSVVEKTSLQTNSSDPVELKKAVEVELPEISWEMFQEIYNIETSCAIYSVGVSCLEIASVIKFNKPCIYQKESMKNTTQVQKSYLRTGDSDSSSLLQKPTHDITRSTACVSTDKHKTGDSPKELVIERSECSISTSDLPHGKSFENIVTVSKILSTDVECVKKDASIVNIDSESDEELISYLSNSTSKCSQQSSVGKHVQSQSLKQSFFGETDSMVKVEKDDLKTFESLRRSSRMVKPTTKVLEQLEIADIDFETKGYSEKKVMTKGLSPEIKLMSDVGNIPINSRFELDHTSKTPSNDQQHEQTVFNVKDCTLAQSNNSSNENNASLNYEQVNKTNEDISVNSCSVQNNSFEQELVKVKLKQSAGTTEVQKAEVSGQDKPRLKWIRLEQKGEREPGTFEPSRSKVSRQSSQSLFLAKGVPPKLKKRLKSYMSWRHSNRVIPGMLSAEQLKKHTLYFQKPNDTDIRIKELKMGQSWKEHLFDHKTQALKMPKTLVYIPKTTPEDLSFNVPPQFILTKSPGKSTGSKLQSTKYVFKNRLLADDKVSAVAVCSSTGADDQKSNSKKKVSQKRKKFDHKPSSDSKHKENSLNQTKAECRKTLDQNRGHKLFTDSKLKPQNSNNSKTMGIPNSGTQNKSLSNVIEFSKFLRQSESDKTIENMIVTSDVNVKSACTSSPTKSRERRSKFNRRVESVKSALHEITKQKVIRKLTGQTPFIPQKNLSVKKVFPVNCLTGSGTVSQPIFELPPIPVGQQKFMLPGKAMSVEVVEVERTSTGEMVLHTQAENYKCNLQNSASVVSSDFVGSAKAMTDVSALLSSFLEQQKQPKAAGAISMRDNNLSPCESIEQDEPEDSMIREELESIVTEQNNDFDTTLSYNECAGPERVCEELFEDLTSEQNMLSDTEGPDESSPILNSSLDRNTTNKPPLKCGTIDLVDTSDSMPLLFQQSGVPPESHSTPRRSPRRISKTSSSPSKKRNSDGKTVLFQVANSPVHGQTAETNRRESSEDKSLKRSMLKELKSSSGYIADKITKTSDSLFDDPSRLSREERALQRAIIAFSELEEQKTMEKQKVAETESPHVLTDNFKTALKKQKEKDNAKKKANRIKKNAVKRSNKNVKKENDMKGFRDFIPKILDSRTRFHNTGLKMVGTKCEPENVGAEKACEVARMCSVCSGTAYVHRVAGVPCCSACRVFYTRCLRLRLQYKCKLDGHCPILPERNTKCAGCRQRRCQEVGLYSTDAALVKTPVQAIKASIKRRSLDQEHSPSPQSSTTYKKMKLGWSSKQKEESESMSSLLYDDDLPELTLLEATQCSWGKGKSKAWSGGSKGKAWKPKNLTPSKSKSKKTTRVQATATSRLVITITDDEESSDDSESSSKPMVYIDRADMPSPDFGKLYEGADDNDSMFDALETVSLSTTMSVDGCRVKIPAEVKKISVNRDSGESVLHKAARLGYRDVVLWCCQTGYADPRGQDYAGFAPIHECCAAGEIEITKILLAYGADVNVASKVEGVRPLHDAVESDHIEMVRLVLSCGADSNLSTYSGKTVQDLIRSKEMMKFLEAYMTDINGSITSTEEQQPWQFRDFLIEGEEDSDIEELGQSIFDDVPSDTEDVEFSLADDIHFELSDSPIIPVYSMAQDLVDGNYALLEDIMDGLDMTRLEFTRQIEAHIHTTTYETLSNVLKVREVPAGYQLIPESTRKLKAPVDLVRWDSRFQELFGVEEVIVSPSAGSCHDNVEEVIASPSASSCHDSVKEVIASPSASSCHNSAEEVIVSPSVGSCHDSVKKVVVSHSAGSCHNSVEKVVVLPSAGSCHDSVEKVFVLPSAGSCHESVMEVIVSPSVDSCHDKHLVMSSPTPSASSAPSSAYKRQCTYTPPSGACINSETILYSCDNKHKEDPATEKSSPLPTIETNLLKSSHLKNYFNMISPERSTLFAFQDESFEHLSPPAAPVEKVTHQEEDKSNEANKITKNPKDKVPNQKARLVTSDQKARLVTSDQKARLVSSIKKDTVKKNHPSGIDRSSVRDYGRSDIKTVGALSDRLVMAQYYRKEHDKAGPDSKDQNWNQFNLYPKSSV